MIDRNVIRTGAHDVRIIRHRSARMGAENPAILLRREILWLRVVVELKGSLIVDVEIFRVWKIMTALPLEKL